MDDGARLSPSVAKRRLIIATPAFAYTLDHHRHHIAGVAKRRCPARSTTIRSKSGIREHPLLKHQLATRSFIVRSLHRLSLDIEPARHEIGRPAGPYRGEA
jgi:hypothetical protein